MTTIVTTEQLVASGFAPTATGSGMAKTLKAADMPYFREHIVDNNIAFETDDISVSVNSDGTLTLEDLMTGYREDGILANSDEGVALLVDAGFIAG